MPANMHDVQAPFSQTQKFMAKVGQSQVGKSPTKFRKLRRLEGMGVGGV